MGFADCPPISDLQACEAWLARAALTDPRRACHELTTLLETLEEHPPAHRDHLDILERLREPIAVAQHAHSKRYATRPLPLRPEDTAAFHQVVDLCSSFGRAYRRLLESRVDEGPAEGRAALAPYTGLLAQRALDCVVDLMLAHYRCRRELHTGLWRELHQLYRIAEALGVARQTVPAGRRLKAVSSPAEVYARALLLALAHPYSLTARELHWLRHWSAKWGFKVELRRQPSEDGCHAVDLASDEGPFWHSEQPGGLEPRFLDMSALRRSVLGRLRKLERGETPAALGLGKDCTQPEGGRLLRNMARAWLEAPTPRRFRRRPAPEHTELLSGLPTIHLALGGAALKNAGRHWNYSRRDAEQLFIYQGVAGAEPTAAPITGEQWETLDESATGFRLQRAGPGERLYHQQLVALRPAGGKAFILCSLRWLMVGVNDVLMAGALALPGLPQAIAVRPAVREGETPEDWMHGFLLSSTSDAERSLVLPAGWYQPERVLEIQQEEGTSRLRLQTQTQRGYDYELVRAAPET